MKYEIVLTPPSTYPRHVVQALAETLENIFARHTSPEVKVEVREVRDVQEQSCPCIDPFKGQ